MTHKPERPKMQPSLFVGHGAPDLITSNIPARQFLSDLGRRFRKPSGIVIISAHWCTSNLQMTPASPLRALHDFSGFGRALYDIQYPASGADWLNQKLANALTVNGHSVHVGTRQGLDHGAWVPLSLMYPDSEIPVAQLSLLSQASPEQHFHIGQALASLRQEGILVLGSGGLVHNLRTLQPEGSPPELWAQSFDQWLFYNLGARDLAALFDYANSAKYSLQAHPTNEHLMPLYVSMGAGWHDGVVERIHHSFSYGNLSMSAYAFSDLGM